MKQRHDHFYKRAKQERYPARSVYKLKEANEKWKFIGKSDRVLDVGCTPGSWAQYLCEEAASAGTVTGVDLNPCEYTHPRFHFMQGDIQTLPVDDVSGGKPFDLVVSDAMPNTTSDPDTNHFQSIGLAELIFFLLPNYLKPGGHFYIKVYDGADFPAYRKNVQAQFEKVSIFKPKSSRDESRELFVFGRGFNPPNG